MFTFEKDWGNMVGKLPSLDFIWCPTDTVNTEAEGWAYSPDNQSNHLQSCLRTRLQRGEPGGFHKNPLHLMPQYQHKHRGANRIGQKHLIPALLPGKKVVRPRPQTPQLDWSTSWAGKTKDEKGRKIAEEHQATRHPTPALLQAFVSNNSRFLWSWLENWYLPTSERICSLHLFTGKSIVIAFHSCQPCRATSALGRWTGVFFGIKQKEHSLISDPRVNFQCWHSRK